LQNRVSNRAQGGFGKGHLDEVGHGYGASAKLIGSFSSSNATVEQTRSINWIKLQQAKVVALLKKNGIK
jgi:hypothetical protein